MDQKSPESDEEVLIEFNADQLLREMRNALHSEWSDVSISVEAGDPEGVEPVIDGDPKQLLQETLDDFRIHATGKSEAVLPDDRMGRMVALATAAGADPSNNPLLLAVKPSVRVAILRKALTSVQQEVADGTYGVEYRSKQYKVRSSAPMKLLLTALKHRDQHKLIARDIATRKLLLLREKLIGEVLEESLKKAEQGNADSKKA